VRLAAPPFTWGLATYPSDGHSAVELLDAAHDELGRRRERPHNQDDDIEEQSVRDVRS